jgi:hypothetical protein
MAMSSGDPTSELKEREEYIIRELKNILSIFGIKLPAAAQRELTYHLGTLVDRLTLSEEDKRSVDDIDF